MKNLLWKDYRQNRRLLLGAAIFLLLPYVTATLGGILIFLRGQEEVEWPYVFYVAAVAGLLIATLACTFVAGNAVAGERADRSAEFLAQLPIPSRFAIASKAALSVGFCVSAWIANLLVMYWTGNHVDARPEFLVLAGIFGAAAILIFGVAWMFSVLLNSPSNAAALGLAAAVLVGLLMGLIGYLRTRGPASDEQLFAIYLTVCLVVGLGGFVSGIVRYLQQTEY